MLFLFSRPAAMAVTWEGGAAAGVAGTIGAASGRATDAVGWPERHSWVVLGASRPSRSSLFTLLSRSPVSGAPGINHSSIGGCGQ
jgi:hypothetical protein